MRNISFSLSLVVGHNLAVALHNVSAPQVVLGDDVRPEVHLVLQDLLAEATLVGLWDLVEPDVVAGGARPSSEQFVAQVAPAAAVRQVN